MTTSVQFIVELIKTRDNMLRMSNDSFSLTDIRDIISFYILFNGLICVFVCFYIHFSCFYTVSGKKSLTSSNRPTGYTI